MTLLPRPYPDEVLGSVLARGARHLGLSWARLLTLATGRSPSSAPALMPFALGRLSRCTGTDPEVLLERHTLFPYAAAFMPLARREALKARALGRDDVCGIDALSHVVLGSTPFRRVCPRCMTEDLRVRGESYWRRQHLLPGVLVCAVHGEPLQNANVPLQHGRGAADGLLPADVAVSPIRPPLDPPVLESLALLSVRALIRPPADANWLERYWVAAMVLGYVLRRRAVAAAALSADLGRFYGAEFLAAMGAPVHQGRRSPWPALLVRPQYPTRLAAPKHVLMQTFIEFAVPAQGVDRAVYRKPGPSRRDYRIVDAEALERMRRYVRENAGNGRRLWVRELLEASGERACMKRFPHRFPRSRRFLWTFRRSRHAARRVRIDT